MFYYKYQKYYTKLIDLIQYGGCKLEKFEQSGYSSLQKAMVDTSYDFRGKINRLYLVTDRDSSTSKVTPARSKAATSKRATSDSGKKTFPTPSMGDVFFHCAHTCIATNAPKIEQFFNDTVATNKTLVFIDMANISHNLFVLINLLIARNQDRSVFDTVIKFIQHFASMMDDPTTTDKLPMSLYTEVIAHIITFIRIATNSNKYAFVISQQYDGTKNEVTADANILHLKVSCTVPGMTPVKQCHHEYGKNESDDIALVMCYDIFMNHFMRDTMAQPLFWTADKYNWINSTKLTIPIVRSVLLVTYAVLHHSDHKMYAEYTFDFIPHKSTTVINSRTIIAIAPGVLNEPYMIMDNAMSLKHLVGILTYVNPFIANYKQTRIESIFGYDWYPGDDFDTLLLRAFQYKTLDDKIKYVDSGSIVDVLNDFVSSKKSVTPPVTPPVTITTSPLTLPPVADGGAGSGGGTGSSTSPVLLPASPPSFIRTEKFGSSTPFDSSAAIRPTTRFGTSASFEKMDDDRKSTTRP